MVNGLINIFGFIGNFFGSFVGGWFVDEFCDWRSRKNNGVFELENRLYFCIFLLLIIGVGCVLFGYGVERIFYWILLFFGYGMVLFVFIVVFMIMMVYVLDCLLLVNLDVLMFVNGMFFICIWMKEVNYGIGSKNIVVFGFFYGIVLWVEEVGYVECFGI